MGGFWRDLDDKIQREVVGILLLALAAIGFLGLLGPESGVVGGFLRRVCVSLLGSAGAPILPAVSGLLGGLLLFGRVQLLSSSRIAGLVLAILSLLVYFHRNVPAPYVADGWQGEGGGLIGGVTTWIVVAAFGTVGRDVFLIVAGLLSLPLILHLALSELAAALLRSCSRAVRRTVSDFKRFVWEEQPLEGEAQQESSTAADQTDSAPSHEDFPVEMASVEGGIAESPDDFADMASPQVSRVLEESAVSLSADSADWEATSSRPLMEEFSPAPSGNGHRKTDPSAYRLPPLHLLRKGPNSRSRREEQGARQKARQLEETLESFGVKGRVVGIQQGPAVTRFELEPATGVRVSKIQNLANDIALTLAATDVRIEAPIPGKSLVGIEVPNREILPVYLRDVLESQEFQHSPSKLTVALGRDIAGQAVVAGLDRLLHLLVAGATGSGKSVCINALLASLLYKAKPEEVKLVLIDPKVVELNVYNGIPHLLVPVITDPKRAASSLRWLVREMERRYAAFADAGTRDIERFNASFAGTEERLPYIVVVIDELADLMMVAPVDVEDAIQRLAQMARAAGIHLVMATQRPSVDVITGVIKANIPSRIAFAVSSQTDSRVILDAAGAEKLVGKGDMLFSPMGSTKMVRLQGAFLSESELENLLTYVRSQGNPEYRQEVLQAAEEADMDATAETDDLLSEAVRLVVETGQASVSMLQRRLRVGYTRAGRLIDIMEAQGVVGPYQGSKAREVRITLEEYRRRFASEPE